MKNYVCIDLETTGLNINENEIIEIGAIKVCDNEIEDTFSQLVKPAALISSYITQITGINNSMVKDSPDIATVLPQLIDFIDGLPLIAHNIRFDYNFLRVAAKKCNLDFTYTGIDTLRIARFLLPNLHSKSLASLCEYFNIKNKSAHRALSDCYATVELFETFKSVFFAKRPKLFVPSSLYSEEKKEQRITISQINQLTTLVTTHQLTLGESIDKLSRNTASRLVNYILQHYEK